MLASENFSRSVYCPLFFPCIFICLLYLFQINVTARTFFVALRCVACVVLCCVACVVLPVLYCLCYVVLCCLCCLCCVACVACAVLCFICYHVPDMSGAHMVAVSW